MARIEGIDVSHWNTLETIAENLPEFVFIKLTEGKTYRDNMALRHMEQAKEHHAAIGFYHYARAEKNDAVSEAEFFVANIPESELNTCVLALDYEGKALSIKDVDTWALIFCKRVEELAGKKPLLYCSQSTVKRFPYVAACGFGLWVARYRNKLLGHGDIKPWKFCAVWQYTSKGVDRNIFYGTRKQFLKYGEVKRNV